MKGKVSAPWNFVFALLVIGGGFVFGTYLWSRADHVRYNEWASRWGLWSVSVKPTHSEPVTIASTPAPSSTTVPAASVCGWYQTFDGNTARSFGWMFCQSDVSISDDGDYLTIRLMSGMILHVSQPRERVNYRVLEDIPNLMVFFAIQPTLPQHCGELNASLGYQFGPVGNFGSWDACVQASGEDEYQDFFLPLISEMTLEMINPDDPSVFKYP